MASYESLEPQERDILDIKALTLPISDEKPTGDDIRDDPSSTSPYYTIKDARNAARSAERNNLYDGGSSEANEYWRKVERLAPEILKNNSKDLEIVSWFTEALIRRKGFTGLRDAFRLMHALIKNYWDDLYPLPDEYGVETRVSSLTGLNGQGYDGVLMAPIRNAAITDPDADPGPYSFWQYQQVSDTDHIDDAATKKRKEAKLGFDMDDYEKAVLTSSVDFFVNVRDDIRESIDTYNEIGSLLDEYCGLDDSPPISNIRNTLEECLGAVLYTGEKKFSVEQIAEPVDLSGANTADATQVSSAGTVQAGTTSGPVKSRQDAFKKITEIAEFLRKTEPHSPISYILERAVVWGEMSLEELMQELLVDKAAIDKYGTLTGIDTSPSGNAG